MPVADKMAGKGAQSPFYVNEASMQKKKPARKPKPASGMIAALQDARSANRNVDSELKAMQARIAALQEAEADADNAIQRARCKAERILTDRSAANKVDYVREDGASSKTKQGSSGSGAKTLGKTRPPSNPRPRSTDSDSKLGQTKPSDAGKRSSSFNGRRKGGEPAPADLRRRTSDPQPAAHKAGRSMSVDRRKGSGATPSRTEDGRPNSGERGAALITTERQELLKRSTSRQSSLNDKDPEQRTKASSSAAKTRQKKETTQDQAKYIHPALLEGSDSDDDDGPSLAEALGMPGLGLGMADGFGALDGLLARYDQDDAMPLQDIIDAAEAEILLVEQEEARRSQPNDGGGAVVVDSFGCVSDFGAGAWG